jgi:Fe-S-cluster containining protein
VLTVVDERYHCTGCGECCSGWSVPLQPGEAERFARAAAPHVPVARLARAVQRDATLVGAGGTCVALADDRRCLVHDGEGQPLACRLFPFTFVATPAGVRVGLSFACPGVLDGEGAPLAGQRDAIAELHARIAATPFLLRLGDTIELAPGLALPFADADALLAALADALAGGGTLVEKLCRAGAVCALVQARLGDGRGFAQALDEARAGRDRLTADALAAPPRPNRLSRALLRTLVDASAPGARGTGSRLGGLVAALGGGGRVRLAGGEVARRAVDAVARGVGSDGEALLARWLTAEVASLTFCGPAAFGLSIAGGLDLLTLSCAAAAYLARAWAAHDGHARVELDDVRRALRQIYAGIHHRAAMPPRFERALAATDSLDLLRAQL